MSDPDLHRTVFAARNYNLRETLSSGQTFRWIPRGKEWTGVLGRHWLRLAWREGEIIAQAAEPTVDWEFLKDFLQLDEDLEAVLRAFPGDPQMRAAIESCLGLRLLRQEPWECLASFILSSTKQIVQIQQVIALLCERFGDPVIVPPGELPAWTFPSAARLAELKESDLRACKMGFRAPYLLNVAQQVAKGHFDLSEVRQLPLAEARAKLITLPGVGPKIADCVLLFAYGFPTAFPMDVWILKALRHLYFPKRRPTLKRLRRFAGTYFGPRSGYAQQYLFHYMRTLRRVSEPIDISR